MHRLDTLCQLRVLPLASAGRKAALDEGQWYKVGRPLHVRVCCLVCMYLK